ncbi:unnamed protein product [Vicia faba]|uniref:Uncharacterized protein n=1 Tax=Vicia faba TaxID=3906 RepID=A0AAV1ABG3_VICFA|nr:unnamed protein product [Vicia faba]
MIPDIVAEYTGLPLLHHICIRVTLNISMELILLKGIWCTLSNISRKCDRLEDSAELFKKGVLLHVDHQQFVDIVIGNFTNVIKEIYDLGGRKFGFVNVGPRGPIGCSPSIRILVKNGRKDECLEEISEVARLHNKKLTKMVQKLENELKGFKYSITDFYSALSQVLKYPSKYGFKEASRACCGSGPYEKTANQYFAKLIWNGNGNGNVTRPYNLKQLFEI